MRAVVVKRAEATDLDETALIEWCRGRMAAYKVPRSIRFAEALPRNGAGKVQWRDLAESETRALQATPE